MALYPFLRPLIFRIDAERAHRLTVAALKAKPARRPPEPDPVLAIEVAGLAFPNPIGLAAGFDKNAEVFAGILGLGFGFAEVGTLTPLPQAGNPRPRLFRLVEDRAVINRMGFNNEGQRAAAERLRARPPGTGIVGVNIGANKDSANRIADYAAGVRTMQSVADYMTVNISSPNTPGLRDLQGRQALDELLAAVAEARGTDPPIAAVKGPRPSAIPLFLKVAPDLEPGDIDDIAEIASVRGINGLIIANTTLSRPLLKSAHRGESGGLSGAPLKALALQRLKDFRKATGGAMPLVAAGGIESGADAFERILAGASLVQL